MKLTTQPQNVTFSGSFEQRDVAIGDVAFILDMFADKVYSNKERAVIRELACNAHDSHVMAGTTDIPFNVHLPTELEPWFSLRDYGTGLPDDDIANIYGAIGVSTKRDSNDVIGCFGIGSLSPYSMCDSFIVKSYLDGIVRTYQCMRDERRQPKVIPLGSAPTDEPNGLEVKLTVNGKVSEFEEEAGHVFMFWEGTLPKINNQYVIRKCQDLRDKYIFKGDDFGLTPSWGSMYALMGNIAYKIPNQLDEFDVDGYLKFDLGELEFDTARENLSMTDKTKAALKAKFESVKDSLAQIAVDQIEAEDTPFKKAALAENLSKGQLGRFVGLKNLDCYGLPEPAESVTYWQSKYRGSEKYHTHSINATGNVKYYLDKPRMQTRIRSWLKDMESGHIMYIFKDLAQAKECGIPEDMLCDLEELPTSTSSRKTGTASKCKTLKWSNDRWRETDLELDGSEIVYVEINRYQPVNSKSLYLSTNGQIQRTLRTSKEYNICPSVFGLKTAFLKTAAFRKGNFIHLCDYLRREFKKIAPSAKYPYSHADLFKLEKINNVIDNPQIAGIIELVNDHKDESELALVCENLGVDLSIEQDDSIQELMDEFYEMYEMLKFVETHQINRMYNQERIANYIGGTLKNCEKEI